MGDSNIPDSAWVTSVIASAFGSTNTSLVADATIGSGYAPYIKSLSFTNAHATTDAVVRVISGTANIWEGRAGRTGGGFDHEFNPPLKGTEASGITVVGSAAGTLTGAVRWARGDA
jgi:hypothetical protein